MSLTNNALKIGPYQVSSIETGSFGLDGGAMFGIIPKTFWEKSNPADDQNRIDMRARAMLVQAPAQGDQPAINLLVDCGLGTKWSDKLSEIYKIDYQKWSLVQELGKKGLKPEDITHFVATHLHFDHVGGLTIREKPGDPKSEILPMFPNAKVYIQRRNWDLAWHPNEKDKASYLSENYSLYKDGALLGRKLELLETRSVDPTGPMAYDEPKSDEEEILPGISVFLSHGHTPGMQLVRVSDGKQSIVYCADMIPTATHVRVNFIMGYDCYPIFILKEKKQLLKRVLEEGSYLFYEHCPYMVASKVGMDAKGHYHAKEPLQI